MADTVAAPIEQQVNGVENMLYMSSQSTNDGGYTLTVTFEVGTDLDMAQVLVQNRVNLALPSLPAEVKQTGVTVKKKSPSVLMIVNLIRPTTRTITVFEQLCHDPAQGRAGPVEGVGDMTYLGQRDYSMRVWLDPERMASRKLSASDVVAASRSRTPRSRPGHRAATRGQGPGVPVHDQHDGRSGAPRNLARCD